MFIIDNLSVLEVIFLYVFGVTPRAGVWIEILALSFSNILNPSLPVRECGLKSAGVKGILNAGCVTPRAGVWIEIGDSRFQGIQPLVTPRAGVWIEMYENIID